MLEVRCNSSAVPLRFTLSLSKGHSPIQQIKPPEQEQVVATRKVTNKPSLGTGEGIFMETLTTKPEQLDLQERRRLDTITWLAETLPGSMRTPFEYRFDGRELYASDGGALEPVFDDAIEAARMLPAYEYRRRLIEKQEYRGMLAMMRGELPNTMIVVSDFPPELMHVRKDVGGYNAARKQTMLRVLTKTPEGTLKMYSQSLDHSNRRALESIYEYFGQQAEPGELLDQRIHAQIGPKEQEFLIGWLTNVYDRSMQAQYGGDWYAGQFNGRRTNTYDFVCQQQDLIKTYLATTTKFTGGIADYNLAAAIEARFLNNSLVKTPQFVAYGIAAHALAVAEMKSAGDDARLAGKSYSGCGMTTGGQSSLSATEQLTENGYGNNANKSKDNKLPSMIRCINCREKVPKKDVIKVKSWCCPSCKYEVDICNGRVICAGVKKK